MARLATVAAPHLCGRVRCGLAHLAYDTVFAESVRFLPAQGAYTLCDRAVKWWFTLASRFQPGSRTKRNGSPPFAICIDIYLSLALLIVTLQRS